MRSLYLTMTLTLTLTLGACGTDDSSPGGGEPSPNGDVVGASDVTTTSDTVADDTASGAQNDATSGSEDTGAGPDPTEDVGTPEEDTSTPTPTDPLEVNGTWDTNFDMVSEITSETWDGSAITHYDNDDNWAIVQMPEDAEWNPGTYSKFVWTDPADGRWFLCIVDYGLDTPEEAQDTPATADASSPLEGGCGDFPWTELRTPLELKGDWHTNWDENITLTTYAWGSQEAMVHHDNEGNWAITRMSADAEWNPNTYSKQVWTEPGDDGSLWVCTVDYGLETAAAAKATEKTADDTDPASGGCGGFSWTQYMPALELTGYWVSEWDEPKIDSTVWGLDLVRDYDNDANWAVVQLPETDEWNPSKFTKNVWTEPTAEGFYFCSVAFGLETLEEAVAAEDTSDASDPDVTGCGGFPWTWLQPAE